MEALKWYYFNDKGENIDIEWIKSSNEEILNKANEYHNKATYKALEFYIKVVLAIFGGMAYLALNPNNNSKTLIEAGEVILILITILFCALIIVHQKSKIIRWTLPYKWYSPLLWNEYWFVTISITLAFFTCHLMAQYLVVKSN